MNHSKEWNCVFACGRCCQNVPMKECQPLQSNGYCKFSTDSGCTLPRAERPKICNHFSCNVSRIESGWIRRGINPKVEYL